MIKVNYAQLANHMAHRYSLRAGLLVMRDLTRANIKELIAHINDTCYLEQLRTRIPGGLSDERKARYINRLIDEKMQKLAM